MCVCVCVCFHANVIAWTLNYKSCWISVLPASMQSQYDILALKGPLASSRNASWLLLAHVCSPLPPVGISSVLFETRLGCMNEKVPEETEKFIFSVGEMFRLSPIVVLFPKSTWPYLPFWKHFVAVWDHLFTVGERNSLLRYRFATFTFSVKLTEESIVRTDNSHTSLEAQDNYFVILWPNHMTNN